MTYYSKASLAKATEEQRAKAAMEREMEQEAGTNRYGHRPPKDETKLDEIAKRKKLKKRREKNASARKARKR